MHSEKGPGVTFAIFLTFRGGGGGIFNGVKLTGGGRGGGGGGRGVHFHRVKMDRGVHFQRLKMDRGGSILHRGGGPFSTVENGPGGPFSTVENGPGGTFLGRSILNLTPALPALTVEAKPPIGCHRSINGHRLYYHWTLLV